MTALVLVGACGHGPSAVAVASPSPIAAPAASPSSSGVPESTPSPLPPIQATAIPVPTPTPSPTSAAPAPGTWLRWKLMSSPRADFTATLLPNGHVLLAGGEASATSSTATVDIFDPVTMSITPAAPMTTARSGHTATLLQDGRVLVVGGSSAPGGMGLASAEIYDSTADTWSPVTPMQFPRVHHAAVRLENGTVLVAGGSFDRIGTVIYDPVTNTWSAPGGVVGDPRPFGPSATIASDGSVDIFGGVNSNDRTVNSDVEIYDPAKGQVYFYFIHPPVGRNYATATWFANSTLIVAGGQTSTSPAGALSSTDLYDVMSPTWPSGPSMDVGHCHHTATLLKNGLLLVAGGRCGGADSIDVCELYDPIAKTWSPAGRLQDARGYHAAALLPDGRVIVAGGFYPGGTISNNVEIYTPA